MNLGISLGNIARADNLTTKFHQDEENNSDVGRKQKQRAKENYNYDFKCRVGVLTARFVKGTPSNPSGTT